VIKADTVSSQPAAISPPMRRKVVAGGELCRRQLCRDPLKAVGSLGEITDLVKPDGPLNPHRQRHPAGSSPAAIITHPCHMIGTTAPATMSSAMTRPRPDLLWKLRPRQAQPSLVTKSLPDRPRALRLQSRQQDHVPASGAGFPAAGLRLQGRYADARAVRFALPML